MTTREDINSILNILKASFPNFHPVDGTSAIYEMLLRDLDLDELRAAVLACCSEPGRAFAPSIGEIRGAVIDIRRQVRGLPTALEAWGEVQRHIGQRWFNTPYSIPLIDKIVSDFGMANLIYSEDTMADRAHFLKAYELAVQKQTRLDVQLPQVTAYIEKQKANMPELPAPVSDPLRVEWQVESEEGPRPYVPPPPEIAERLRGLVKSKEVKP